MKTRARSPRRRDMLAALIASVLMGLPPSAHASSLRPTSALVDERCDLAVIHDAVIDDAVAARLRCARLRFLQVLAGRYDRSQPSASEVVAAPSPARLFAAVAGAPAPPTPTRFAAGAALIGLLVALIVGWRRSLPLQAIER
jgi:hypothetical protein